MRKLSYRLFLYSPAAAAVTLDNSTDYFLGELYADNVDVNLKLQDVSTISFTLPQVINGAANPRLNQVLDSYVIELWYGKIDGVYANGDFKKMRFIIYKTPQEFNDDKYLYKYSGYSLESILEFKNIVSWQGIKINDYYRTISYNNSSGSPAFTDANSSSVTISGSAPKQYIAISPTTATVRELDVYLYEIRENLDDEITTKTSLISYESLSGTPWTDADFKAGYYYLEMDGDYVDTIYIALPENYTNFDDYLLTEKKFSYHLYDNPVGRHIAFGITKNEGVQTNFYIDLAQQANAGDETPEYEGYTFNTEYDYFKNGLTIKQIMLGDQEETTLSEDGVLYNTGFTLGTVHEDFDEMYRSNIELNNLTKYQAIKTIAESFDAIPVFDSVNKTVSFYPENPTANSPWTNNGLIFQYGAYLRAVQKDIDASKIITMGRGLGKDNYPISLVTPDGQPVWEDYEYFLDDFYITDTTGFTIVSDGTTGLDITYPAGKSSYLSRWMSAAQAEALGGWQYTRDYFHNLMAGAISPIDSNHNDFENLYADRLAAFEARAKLSTELEKRRAIKFKYYTLKEHYKKQNIAAPSTLYNERQVYYEGQYDSIVEQISDVQLRLAALDTLIYDETSSGSFAYKLAQVRDFLDKETWGVDLTLLQTFQRESVVSDSKIDYDYELLLSTITHVNENKLPKITIQMDVADILAAEEAYQDWDKVVVGEAVNIYLPEINIDDEVLVREISINFETNNLALVISSVRNYNKSILTSAFKLVRELKNSEMNFSGYLYDRNNENDTIVQETQTTIENGDAPVNPSTDDTDGEPGTTIDPEGTQSSEVDDESVDPETETYEFVRATTGVIVHDGRVLGFKQYTLSGQDPFTIETELSATNGFEIRKVEGSAENDDLVVTKQAYIDTEGNGVFGPLYINNISSNSVQETIANNGIYEDVGNPNPLSAPSTKTGTFYFNEDGTLAKIINRIYFEVTEVGTPNTGIVISLYYNNNLVYKPKVSLSSGILDLENLNFYVDRIDITISAQITGQATVDKTSIEFYTFKATVDLNNLAISSNGDIDSPSIVLGITNQDKIKIIPEDIGTSGYGVELKTPEAGLTDTRIIRFPDKDGIIALTSDLNDTNTYVTSGSFSDDNNELVLTLTRNDAVDIDINLDDVVKYGFIYGKAESAITKGQVVQFSGVQGDHILVKPAVPSEINANPDYVVGIARDSLNTNDFGYFITFGELVGTIAAPLDTATNFNEGDILWFASEGATAGALTSTEPTGNKARIQVGAVTKENATEGIILVRVSNHGVELADIMASGTPSSSTFLRGDGSWQIPSLPSLSGTLTVAKGGTGTTSYNNGAVPYYSSTLGTLATTNAGTTQNSFLITNAYNGVHYYPSWNTASAAALILAPEMYATTTIASVSANTLTTSSYTVSSYRFVTVHLSQTSANTTTTVWTGRIDLTDTNQRSTTTGQSRYHRMIWNDGTTTWADNFEIYAASSTSVRFRHSAGVSFRYRLVWEE